MERGEGIGGKRRACRCGLWLGAGGARPVVQLEVVDLDEVVPRLDELFADVAAGPRVVQLVPHAGAVVVADKGHTVAGPAADDRVGITADGAAFVAPSAVPVVITTTTLVALAKEEREDGTGRVGGPFPKLGAATDAPGAHEFFFVCVHCCKILTHGMKGEGSTKKPPTGAGGREVSPTRSGTERDGRRAKAAGIRSPPRRPGRKAPFRGRWSVWSVP